MVTPPDQCRPDTWRPFAARSHLYAPLVAASGCQNVHCKTPQLGSASTQFCCYQSCLIVHAAQGTVSDICTLLHASSCFLLLLLQAHVPGALLPRCQVDGRLESHPHHPADGSGLGLPLGFSNPAQHMQSSRSHPQTLQLPSCRTAAQRSSVPDTPCAGHSCAGLCGQAICGAVVGADRDSGRGADRTVVLHVLGGVLCVGAYLEAQYQHHVGHTPRGDHHYHPAVCGRADGGCWRSESGRWRQVIAAA